MEEDNNPIQENGASQNVNQNNNGVKKVNTYGVISFIFSLVGLLIAGLPCGIVALITGIIGLVKFNKATEKMKGFAIAGIVIGVFDIVAVLLNVVLQVMQLTA